MESDVAYCGVFYSDNSMIFYLMDIIYMASFNREFFIKKNIYSERPKKKSHCEYTKLSEKLFIYEKFIRESLLYFTSILYFIFESNSYQKFYFLKSFSKKNKKIYIFVT